MAGIRCPNPVVNRNWMTYQLPFIQQRAHGARCCSAAPGNGNGSKTPQLLKLAVSGVTELLRLFSLSEDRRLNELSTGEKDEILVSGVDDVLEILKSDYENAYFRTGKQLYSGNVKLLLPFFDPPSIGLRIIEKKSGVWTTLHLTIDGGEKVLDIGGLTLHQ